ncbi:MAG: ABC transporter permease [Ilumatobacteraceae bacterium]
MTASIASEPETLREPSEVVAAPKLHGGWRIVARKEFHDHIHSIRFVILVVLMALAGLASVHSASGPIRTAASAATDVPSIFLYLFTLSPDRVPAFHEFLAILGPLLGIAFGFDAINGERSQRTLPRLVSQPIHRDEVINGKFVAGIGAIALALAAVMAVVVSYGMLRLGVGPTTNDVVRMLAFFVVAVVYIGLWLALAVVLSVLTRRAATAALAGIAIWLVFTLFGGLIAGLVADTMHPVPSTSPSTEQVLANARLELRVRRFSPSELYQEATGVLLNPSRQTTGLIIQDTTSQALPSTLSLSESLVLAWWQVAALVGGVVVMFAAAYALFMRQEVRA